MSTGKKSKSWQPLLVFALLTLVCLLIYSSTYILAYARFDDTWLLRQWPHNKRSAVEQGRPLLWYTFNLTALLFKYHGISSLQIVRFLAALLLPVYGLFQYKWLSRWEKDPITIICLTLAMISLLSCQIIMGNGAWLVPALILVSVAANLFYIEVATDKANVVRYLASTFLIMCSLAFYQGILPLIFAMLMVPVIYRNHPSKLFNKEEWTSFSRAIVVTLCAIFIYYLIWLLLAKIVLPSSVKSKYLPTEILKSILDNIKFFYTLQLRQMSLLWFINGNRQLAFVCLIIATAAGSTLEICRHLIKNNIVNKIPIFLNSLKRLSLIILLLICSNMIFFAVNNGIANRYTASLGLASSILFIYWRFFLELKRLAQDYPLGSYVTNACSSVMILVALSTTVYATFTLSKYITLPSANEFNYVRQKISLAGQFSDINAIMRSTKLTNVAPNTVTPLIEFDWRFNSAQSVYTWHMIRLALLENKLDERRKVTTFFVDESNQLDKQDVYDLDRWRLPLQSINAEGEILTIDFNDLFDVDARLH